MTDTKISIIGAGVVGLAIASRISEMTDSIFVLEKNLKFGQETSSRNSEVVHSGIYYPKGSLKAILCVEGKELLYNYCEQKDIAYNKCGKLIISNSEQEDKVLENILQGAQKNGVKDGKTIKEEEILSLEPHIRAKSALFFPLSGVIDTHGLMKQLETDAINQGAEIVYGAEVTGIRKIDGGYEITVSEQDGPGFSFTTEILINASGLNADMIPKMVGIKNNEYQQYFWKGEYFSLVNGKHKLVSRLVYPVPFKNTVGLGIHTTIDLSGRVKLGPNAIYLSNKLTDYAINPEHKNDFYESAKTYLPFLEPDDLVSDQVGIRPKLQKPGDPVRDFIIKEESQAGFPGFINLIGIESPGLTACLSIANHVANLCHLT
ncbi:MAG: NAD(P)/FAD-dependent oxidoreductase [Bacteroidetes bacterium]|nr:MAG: NAD(P)/FAD-dependent oxidoreductase [Bacteroidota bacterium]